MWHNMLMKEVCTILPRCTDCELNDSIYVLPETLFLPLFNLLCFTVLFPVLDIVCVDNF